MNESESLRVVLSSIFSRRGAETNETKLFGNLPAQSQDNFLTEVHLLEGELPVLASIQAGDRWLLITTARLFYKREGRLTITDLSQLKDATVALGLDAGKGVVKMGGLTSLKLILKSGLEHIVEIEPGLPHAGVWNVLKHVAVINARP